MNMTLKSALMAAALAGAATMVPGVASAATVGVAIVVPAPIVVVSPYGPGYVAYDAQYYYDPIYISGDWYHGPYRWRMHHGQRQFFVMGRWHRNEWRDSTFPTTIVFRNGGRYGNGRYDGFANAERVNARLHAAAREEGQEDRHEDRQDAQHDKGAHHNGDAPNH